jgi:hypothetical protein
MAESVASWTFEKRLENTFTRTLPKLGPEAREQLAAIINPTSLAIVAGVLVAWVVSHLIGIGEIVDIIILVVGVFAIGFAVFTGLDHLYSFAKGAYYATSENDLEVASKHLAEAITILGIQAVLAVLFRGKPNVKKGGPINVGPPPPRTPGVRYKPTVTADRSLRGGEGATSFWGDIYISTRGSANDKALVLLHEKVHQFLVPKLYLLRSQRVEFRAGSYFRSSLHRYIEEALAETIAQVGVNGFRHFFVGIKFPINNGYIFLTKGGGFDSAMTGLGLLPETAALIGSGAVMGYAYQLWRTNR